MLKFWSRWCTANRERTAFRSGHDWAWKMYIDAGLSPAEIELLAPTWLAFDKGVRAACDAMPGYYVPPHWSDDLIPEKNNDHQD